MRDARTGQSEVRDAYTTVGADEHVRRLEVAVNDADRVGRSEAGSGLAVERQHLVDVPPVALPDLEGRPLDVLHHDEDVPLGLCDFVHRDDVGVGELGERLRLFDETAASLGSEALRRQDLDRDGSPE